MTSMKRFCLPTVVLMTNGPYAKIAETVLNTMLAMPGTIYRHPHYYRIRNHLIEFLVDRSRVRSGAAAAHDAIAGGHAGLDETTPTVPFALCIC